MAQAALKETDRDPATSRLRMVCGETGPVDPEDGRGGGVRRVRTFDVAARFVVRLVACALRADEAEMLSGRRGSAEIARARQIAMYLLHTSLSIPYADVAVMFARDRTTVSHACRTIEDLRDDPMHDDQIVRLEEMVVLARTMSAMERHPAGPRIHQVPA